jgi:hypothetical protein
MILFFYGYPVAAQVKSDAWLEQLLRKNASPVLHHVLNNPDSFQYQLIYTQIDRDKNNKPTFRNHYLNVDRARYFFPASTVKMPTALLALEKINALQVPGLTKYTAMLTDSAYNGQTTVYRDTTAANGLPSIAHYIKKIFIVSDNDAYNRLYEFLGQQYINETLRKKGYKDIRIIHRFIRLTPEQNRHTNPVRFMSGDKMIYTQPAMYSKLFIDSTRRDLVGYRYYVGDSLIHQPMDFTFRNRMPLEDLQQILQSVLFPESVPAQKRFAITNHDAAYVWQCMSQLPSESKYPAYNTEEFFNSYTKFFFFRDGKSPIPSSMRVFNKAGWSYGFLTDTAYIIDFENNIEFMLTAVIYVNRDGTLNDDKYEYESIGWPFFRAAGETIYQHELQRKRKHKPDLSSFKFSYE